jgi:hypothetical protein
MSPKTLVSLLIALVLFGGVAYYMNKKPEARVRVSGVGAGELALPALDVNNINAIELVSMSATIQLARASSGWVVESLYEYPAQFSPIAGFLRKLNELKVSQVLRDGEATLAELGLDEGAFAPDRLGVTLSYSTGQSPVRFVLGANKEARDTTGMGMAFPRSRFMRVGEGPSLVVDETFTELGQRSVDWIERELFTLNASDVTAVEVALEDESYVLSRGEDGSYDLSDLAEAESVDSSAALRLFQGLQMVRFDEVMDPEEAIDEEQSDRVVFNTSKGMTYKLTIGREVTEGSRWLSVQYSDVSEDSSNADEVARLNGKHGAWHYKMPAAVMNALTPARETLIAKPEEEAQDGEE